MSNSATDLFDITKEYVAETTTIHVKSASGELLYADKERTKPVQIEIYGPGSEAYSLVEARQSSRSLKRYTDNDNKIDLGPAEEQRKEAAEDLADLTASFNNFAYPPQPDAKGRALFIAVYADKRLGFIAKQVGQAVKDWGKFKTGSAAS